MILRHKWRAAFLALLVIGLALFIFLLRWNGAGDPQPRALSMAQLRALAASQSGPQPASLAAERAGVSAVPKDLFAAGTGLKQAIMGVWSFRVTMADGETILIDTGMTEAQARKLRVEVYEREGQGRIIRAMRNAKLIIPTHEHADHMGGLVALLRNDRAAGEAVLARTLFNRHQLPDQPLSAELDWPLPVQATARIADGAPQAVAPGVVVIPAPGHTPGTQMVFVRTRDGREWLFTADNAAFAANWQELRGRSMLMQLFVPEDRKAVFEWLATVRKLKAEAPGLTVIAGHDYAGLFDAKRQQVIHLGFD